MQQLTGSHQSLEKALILLLAFEHENRELGTVELSKKLGFHKSTVSRMLKVLISYRFLQQNPQNRKISLGPAIVRLSHSLTQSLKTNLVQIAKPFLDELRDTLNETVIFEVLSGNNMVMAYVAEGARPVRLAGSIGDRVPFHAAAGAKAYLAFSEPKLRDSLIGTTLRKFTSNTITDPDEFSRHLDQIRSQGFAFDLEELDEGTRAVGTVVFNHEKKAIAAVVVAGPAQRFTEDHNSPIVSALMQTASKISSQFCYAGGNVEFTSE